MSADIVAATCCELHTVTCGEADVCCPGCPQLAEPLPSGRRAPRPHEPMPGRPVVSAAGWDVGAA